MKKIIAFGASSSTTSINKKFASYAAHQFENATVEVIDLNDYVVPIYSTDEEAKNGIPQLAQAFFDKIGTADLLVISIAEHNGTYTTFFKNIFDWISRIHAETFQHRQLLLLSTSPGPRGAATALQIAADRFPYHAAKIIGQFSLPSFYDNFSEKDGITNPDLKNQFFEIVDAIEL